MVLVAALVAVALSPLEAAHAGDELEAETYSVTATEHWGYDYVYEGQTESFHWRDGGPGRLQAGWMDNGSLAVWVWEEGAEDERFEFEFYPPEGEQLQVGEYTHVRPGAPGDTGRAGMEIEGTSACSQRFRILEIDQAEDRVWLVYEAQCEGRKMNMSGEIRLNVPDQSPGLGVYPQAISWPTYYRNEPGETIPVRLVNRSAVPEVFSRPSVVGTDAFEVLGHDCGTPVPPGGECTIRLRFTPKQVQQVSAVLRVQRESGVAVEVALDGRGYPGHTQLKVRSSHYDDIGRGRDWATRPLRERLEGDPGWYGMDFRSPQFDGEFRAGGHELGTPIEPGIYRHGDDAWLDVHRGFTTTAESECGAVDGWFRVHEMEFGPQGLSRASVSFKQICGDRPWAPLYGAFAWRASEPPPRLPSRVFVSYRSEQAVRQGLRVRGTVRLEKSSGPRRVKVVLVPTGNRSGSPQVLMRRTLDGGEAGRFWFRWKRGWRMSAVPGGKKPLVTASIVFGGLN